MGGTKTQNSVLYDLLNKNHYNLFCMIYLLNKNHHYNGYNTVTRTVSRSHTYTHYLTYYSD